MKNTQQVLTSTGGGGRLLSSLLGFTMAEILLSLTIIGVVAAITLPSLTGNINERTWATQKKALYARMSQAFPLLDSINTYDDAESFIAGALNTVTKINNVCSGSNIEDCGLPNSIAPLNAATMIDSFGGSGGSNQYWAYLGITGTGSNTDLGVVTNASGTAVSATALTAAFETGNGESIVLYYNPNCTTDQELAPSEGAENAESWFKYVCVNMIYDLNNNKGPNTVGKDIGFMTVFYPTDSVVVSPVPAINVSSATTNDDGDVTAAATCSDTEYRLPNKYEAMSMALNNRFMSGAAITGTTTTGTGDDTTVTMGTPVIATSTKGATSSTTYTYSVGGKAIEASSSTLSGNTRCVKR